MNSYAQIKREDAAAPVEVEYRFPPTPPSSDSGYTTASDWSQFSSPTQSPTLLPLPQVRLARSVRGTERQRAKDELDLTTLQSPYYRPQVKYPFPPTPTPQPKSRRIPRPPNAFILYRSDLLKGGLIPDGIERRQQTLSRVAGQCWNLLKPHQKQVWQDLAAERAALHQLEYPDYHFKPAPRGKGKSKVRPNDDNSDDVIRVLRETYLGISGPSICASRQRKPKVQVEGSTQSLPSSLASSPTEVKDLDTYNWTSSSASNTPPPSLPSPEPASNNAPLPPCFPQRTHPHFPAPRRPSTSLGFVRRLDEEASCFEIGSGPERPASASSETGLTNLVRDLNLTPTTANFGHISMPPTPDLYAMPYSPLDQSHNLRTPFHFAALNSINQSAPYPDLVNDMGMGMDPLSTDDAFGDAQFTMTLDDSYGFSPDSNATFSFDNWIFPGLPMGANEQ
ncbi:hypothetical protein B0H16DRAFT_1447785 [Mycena metata]|uniref:HMG box domain-containing protein n=1 Tax=Mycena metata TaxID=1033252 RepID=A0AAD7KE85_9AGAR|nr:hypothetical protein B0H16DRAFT_1447785 [Mycena metata]